MSILLQGDCLLELLKVLGDFDLMEGCFKREEEFSLKLVVLSVVGVFLVPAFRPGGIFVFKMGVDFRDQKQWSQRAYSSLV